MKYFTDNFIIELSKFNNLCQILEFDECYLFMDPNECCHIEKEGKIQPSMGIGRRHD
jgi:hypothetical protein